MSNPTFLDGLNGTLTSSTALAGAMPANLRAAADVYSQDQVDAAIADFATQAALDALTTVVSGKEPTISAGTTAQYWRGDKTWQTLDKTAVGLGSVDNTNDASKPISTATQTALDLKANASDVTTALAGKLASSAVSAYGLTLIDDADASTARTTLGLGTASTLTSDTDTTLAANSDTRLATQKAIKAYVDGIIEAANALQYKGTTDCSANPNYPAASAGHMYVVSVAGKIGGASGITVEVGDALLCKTDSTAAGNHATVGANWGILQFNLVGALTSADIGSTVQAYDVDTAKLDVEDQTITGGGTVTSKSLGTQSSGTLTLDMGDRALQHYTNNGAHTLAPGTPTGACLVDITNGASAGAITTSGWTKVAGASFTTTNGHKFRCHCSVGNGGSLLVVQALQ